MSPLPLKGEKNRPLDQDDFFGNNDDPAPKPATKRKRAAPPAAPSPAQRVAYLRGELATYSPRTLALCYQNILEQKAANINGAQIVLAATMQQYGFSSLAAANEAMKKRFS